MRTAVFGDVHSKYPPLERFFKQTKGAVDAYLCMGDVVHHNSPDCARWADDCVRLLIEHNVPSVNGNHERALLELVLGRRQYRKEEIYNLREFGIPKYSEQTRDFLLGLKDQEKLGEVLIAHESVLGRWMVFPRRDEFEALKERGKSILFFGHSHKRLHFRQDGDFPWWMNYFERDRFFPRFDVDYGVSSGLHLVNPGNLETARPPFGFYECGSYVIYDDNRKTITFKKLLSE